MTTAEAVQRFVDTGSKAAKSQKACSGNLLFDLLTEPVMRPIRG